MIRNGALGLSSLDEVGEGDNAGEGNVVLEAARHSASRPPLRRVAMFVHTLDERAISHQVALLVEPMLEAGVDVLVVAGHPTRGGMARMPPGVRVADLGLGDRPTLLGAPGLAFQLRRWRP